MKATGCYANPTWFSGVSQYCEVTEHVQEGTFGAKTAAMLGVETRSLPPENWPLTKIDIVYGNPLYMEFGPFVDYAVGCGASLAVWQNYEGVLRDQTYTMLGDRIPEGYRLATVGISPLAFGIAIDERWEFHFMYRCDRNFNIAPPQLLSKDYPVLYDVIYNLVEQESIAIPREPRGPGEGYHHHNYVALSAEEDEFIVKLPNGWNSQAQLEFFGWEGRELFRANWLLPLSMEPGELTIHPWKNRPLTIYELSLIRGWNGSIPEGAYPFKQIQSSVPVLLVKWLIEQCSYYLNDHWKDQDYFSSYDKDSQRWVGGDAKGKKAKEFQLSTYKPSGFDIYKYPSEVINPIITPWLERDERGKPRYPRKIV